MNWTSRLSFLNNDLEENGGSLFTKVNINQDFTKGFEINFFSHLIDTALNSLNERLFTSKFL